MITLHYPNWNKICLPFFPFPFFPPVDALMSSLSPGVDGPEVALSLPQAVGAGPLRSSHRTVPRVRPAIKTFGFGAAGKAGNALRSAVFGAGPVEARGAGRAYDDVVVTVGRVAGVLVHAGIAAARLVFGVDSGGNGLLEVLDRLPARPTAEREDCAVDDFRRSTRFPPDPVVPDDSPGIVPLGPGRAG